MTEVERLAEICALEINKYKQQAEAKGVRYGTIHGNMVEIGGVMYLYEVTHEDPVRDGQVVACILNQSMSKAVVL